MKLTQKQKIDGYDALAAHAGKLELAIHSLTNNRFPFGQAVTVDANDIHSEYKRGQIRIRVSVAERAMPLYMIEQDECRAFYYESELRNDSTFWRLVNHAIWKQGQARRAVA